MKFLLFSIVTLLLTTIVMFTHAQDTIVAYENGQVSNFRLGECIPIIKNQDTLVGDIQFSINVKCYVFPLDHCAGSINQQQSPRRFAEGLRIVRQDIAQGATIRSIQCQQDK